MDLDFSDPMFTARASVARRYFGVATQVLLGGLLLYVAFATPPEDLGWQIFLIGLGALALGTAARAWDGSKHAVVLREDGLFCEDGTPIARLSEIKDVDRALFSFKPSNGFIVRMNCRQKRGWVPGMWWRFGRRVGVGGVLPSAQARMMADALSAMVKMRDGAL